MTWAVLAFASGPRTDVQSLDSLNTRSAERNRRLYDSIRTKTERHRVPRMLYDMLFTRPAGDTATDGRTIDESAEFRRFAGKRIGSITIEREPVFDSGGNWLERAGNRMHRITRERIIRRDLFIRPGDEFDPQMLARNKQLLQSRSYISEVRTDVAPDPQDTSAVDIVIRTRDSWTISLDAGVRSRGRTMLGIYDANILGTGTRLGVKTNFYRPSMRYGGNVVEYRMPNIMGSFFTAEMSAGRTFEESELRFDLRKEFLTPTDYEVGFSYNRLRKQYYLTDADSTASVKFRRTDLWGGRSRYIPGIESSVFFTGGYSRSRFDRRPGVSRDLNPAFHNYDEVLFSTGLYREKFYSTTLIYGFGIREYLATGFRAEIIGGYRWGEFYDAAYLGAGVRGGAFTRIGYLMGGFAVGSYAVPRDGAWRQSAIDIDLRWFSNLFRVRRNHIRQFLSLNYTLGWNRSHGNSESIRFTSTDGLRLLSEHPYGTNRAVLNTETVVFTPYQPLGFRIAVVAFADFGLLGFSPNIFDNSFYNTLGMGLRIKNERLIFNTINLRIGLALGKGGILDSRYFEANNSNRMTQFRYMPERPQTIGFE
ncbi:MAG: hypothetical protein K2J51_06975 [Alistipes sp.]|nr:hypothetical protein [Alistipes sp.]